jgi:NAD(P)-dependent dehydrogenase (short-subunit alcohol dehydrogenase family)
MRTRAAAEGPDVRRGPRRRRSPDAPRRIATAEDVARTVVLLAGEHASATTGATIDVNGGRLFT